MAQSPEFSLHMTDGDAAHLPSSEELQKGYAQADPAMTQKALESLAKEVVKIVAAGGFEKGMVYSKVPEGYSLWYHQRANARGRKDWYIYGHPSHIKFDSFAQFALHINHIQDFHQGLGTCRCKACKRAPLTAATIARRDWGPVPSISSPANEEGEDEDDDNDNNNEDQTEDQDMVDEEDEDVDDQDDEDDNEDEYDDDSDDDSEDDDEDMIDHDSEDQDQDQNMDEDEIRKGRDILLKACGTADSSSEEIS